MRFLVVSLALAFSVSAFAQSTRPAHVSNKSVQGPMFKPSSKSKKALDISTNAYGAYAWAPKAPKIGDTIADFKRPSTMGTFDLEKARKKGPVVLVFYRGDW